MRIAAGKTRQSVRKNLTDPVTVPLSFNVSIADPPPVPPHGPAQAGQV